MSASITIENSGVSTVRLHLLRALYLLISVGLVFMVWPGIVNHPVVVPHFTAVVRSFLGALSLLALLGIRYPLKMLPLLLFELLWKFIWLVAFALPGLSAGQLDPAMDAELHVYIVSVVLIAAVLPWRYVLTHYVMVPGDKWRVGRGEKS